MKTATNSAGRSDVPRPQGMPSIHSHKHGSAAPTRANKRGRNAAANLLFMPRDLTWSRLVNLKYFLECLPRSLRLEIGNSELNRPLTAEPRGRESAGW